MPVLCMLLIGFGALFYNLGHYGFTIIAINFTAILLVLSNLFNFTIEMKSVKILMTLNATVIGLSVADDLVLGSS